MILKKPVITEKATRLSDKLQQFTLIVEKKSTKEEIKEAVEKMYDVEVTRVNTMRYAGKFKTRYTKGGGYSRGRRDAYKKAVVTLKEGQTIDFYANV